MVWKSTGEPVKYENPSKHFRFTGTRASCQLEAQVEVSGIDFSWKSDPHTSSKCGFAVMGEEEVKGRYYDSWLAYPHSSSHRVAGARLHHHI